MGGHVFAVFAGAFLVAWPVTRHWRNIKDLARLVLSAALAVSGIAHFLAPQPFVQHLPEWVPSREFIVYASGIIEIGFAAALVFLDARRKTVGWLLALFFVAVFPANVYVAVADVEVSGLPGGAWPWIRLPLQAVLIAWAVWSTSSPPDAESQDRPLGGDASVTLNRDLPSSLPSRRQTTE